LTDRPLDATANPTPCRGGVRRPAGLASRGLVPRRHGCSPMPAACWPMR